VEEAELHIRKAADEFEKAVRRITGSTARFELTVETADVDAYWGYWLDGAGSEVRLRLNLRQARFTRARARQFALHEVLGHGLQCASIASQCSENEVPWVRLQSVHCSQEIASEGLALALPLFVAPEDEDLMTCVRLDHYLQLVRGNDGLVLQPFPGVALMDARPVGKLTDGDGAVGCQSAVQPQLVSDVDVQEVKRSDAGSEQPLSQRPRRPLLFHSPSRIADCTAGSRSV
jgi:hypothetical protein